MRRLFLPALVLLTGCQALDPTLAYREAAKRLTFTLERVDPRLDVTFPLERSRLRLRLVLKVTNDSDVRLHARALGGAFTLTLGNRRHALGQVGFPGGLTLAPRGASEVVAEVAFDYAALKEAWGPLQEAVLRHKAATWHLEGEAKMDALGVGLTLPLRATRNSGS